jgi:hypothetical protein
VPRLPIKLRCWPLKAGVIQSAYVTLRPRIYVVSLRRHKKLERDLLEEV